jgi:hypothetical protein
MAAGDQYRGRAAELSAKAQWETDPGIRIEYENLALAYLRLAEQADRNARADIVYEPPPERPALRPEDPPKPVTEE